MTGDDLDLRPEERRARDAVRELTRPEPEHAFRERLKRDFVTGHVGAPRVLVLRRSWLPRPGVRWALATIGALALLVATLALNRGPGWTVAALAGDGMVVVDGKPVPSRHGADLARLLTPGARVRVPGGVALQIANARFGVIQLAPGADLTLPAPPGRWFARHVEAEVQGGTVRFSTAPAFHGARLAITTPEAAIEVTGTTFAVLCMPEGTCVCVLEGRVRVGEKAGPMALVEQGHRREVFSGDRAPLADRMLPGEVGPLTALRAACDRMTGGGR
jgi:ferric-dicitrate binding protein FerR (iron transport regulator)